MNRIAIEVGADPLVLQLSGEVELTITAKQTPAPWTLEQPTDPATLKRVDRVAAVLLSTFQRPS